MSSYTSLFCKIMCSKKFNKIGISMAFNDLQTRYLQSVLNIFFSKCCELSNACVLYTLKQSESMLMNCICTPIGSSICWVESESFLSSHFLFQTCLPQPTITTTIPHSFQSAWLAKIQKSHSIKLIGFVAKPKESA